MLAYDVVQIFSIRGKDKTLECGHYFNTLHDKSVPGLSQHNTNIPVRQIDHQQIVP